MKNIVIVHMESLSNYIFNMHREFFPFLNNLMKKGVSYKNYYSTATSTLMVITDLFFGDTSIFEKSDFLEDLYTIDVNKKSVFSVLEEQGYFTKFYFYGYTGKERDSFFKLGDIISHNSYAWGDDDSDKFVAEISEDIKSTDKPFALFVEDYYSHIAYSGYRKNESCNGEKEAFADRYCEIDRTLLRTYEAVEKAGKLQDTVFVIYGDHGDEYWFHGFHGGYTHAIEPRESVCHCPLVVWNAGMNEGETKDELLSTKDIYNICLNLALGEKKVIANNYVFMRNLFARQKKYAKMFNKAYAVTDGDYFLLRTMKGFSLYINSIDPMSCTNVLSFFSYKGGKLNYYSDFNYCVSGHYKNFMSENIIREIEEEFYELKRELDTYMNSIGPIRCKYKNCIDKSRKIKLNNIFGVKFRRLYLIIRPLIKGNIG